VPDGAILSKGYPYSPVNGQPLWGSTRQNSGEFKGLVDIPKLKDKIILDNVEIFIAVRLT
jgi:hypothetical protein